MTGKRKMTGTRVAKYFPDAPRWWHPKDGDSKGSKIWNCRRYTAFLKAQGYEIHESGEAQGSPWWIVSHPEDVPEKLYEWAMAHPEAVRDRGAS